MNRLLTAKTFTISAHRLIQDHGLGRQKMICDAIREARRLLQQCPTSSDWHQVDWMCFELAAAITAVHCGHEKDALTSLECVEGALELMIEREPLAAYD